MATYSSLSLLEKKGTVLTNMAKRACLISASRYSQSNSLFFEKFRGSNPTFPAKSLLCKTGGHWTKGMEVDILRQRCTGSGGMISRSSAMLPVDVMERAAVVVLVKDAALVVVVLVVDVATSPMVVVGVLATRVAAVRRVNFIFCVRLLYEYY
jgi:hypothetical protein